MNVFRILADVFHLLAIFILLKKIWKTRSCAGLSGKSQILFALVFLTRYLDLFLRFISLYNFIMKLFFISSSCLTVYFIYKKFKATYDSNHDTFNIFVLILPSILLSLLANYAFTAIEVSLSSPVGSAFFYSRCKQ
ncbi:hypothetical protein P879_11774 [Paragonimus westermani]|uniref:ER lumen protein retaining receptor n=1 Tax=Paragonimus westermani TaxID=34504 RepID=A0A8T0D903_9TREM|nr:hypothetical protein P879_11774 [Paragonimus westermani]